MKRAFFWLAVGMSALPLAPALAHQSPNPAFLDALWVAKSDGVLKVGSTDGELLFEIPNSRNVRGVAVDQQRAQVWAFAGDSLTAYGFEGEALLMVPVPPGPGSSSSVALQVNVDTGAVWLAVGKRLLQFDSQGHLENAFALRQNVVALKIDPASQLLWVATQKEVGAVDPQGNEVRTIFQSQRSEVVDIAVDAGSGDVWVALRDNLQRFDEQGVLELEAELAQIDGIASDNAGGAWLSSGKQLIRIDENGEALLEAEPFQSGGKAVDMVVHPLDLSVWTANQRALAHVSAEGEVLKVIEFGGSGNPKANSGLEGRIFDLALFVDTIPPQIALLNPVQDDLLNTATPAIELSLEDIGIGVDASTLSVLANEQELFLDCTFEEGTATCAPQIGLPEGEVTLSATVRDFNGNLSEPAEVTFTVDTVPPVIQFTFPVAGSAINQNTPLIELRHSDQGSGVDSDTLQVGLDPALSSLNCTSGEEQSACVLANPLPDGSYLLTATIRDRAGNVSNTASVVFLVDTVPPQILFTSPINGGFAGSRRPEIALEHTDAGSGVDIASLLLEANGSQLAISCDSTQDNSICALLEDLPQGLVTATASIADRAGNRSSLAETSFIVDTDPPIISLDEPENGLVTESATTPVSGTVLDRTPLTMTANGVPLAVDGSGSVTGDLVTSLFSGQIPLSEGENVVIVAALDAVGNASSETRMVTRQSVAPPPMGEVGPGEIPPDPSIGAPPLDTSVVTTLASASKFLFSGNDPIQTGVESLTINPVRLAVVRGRVLTREGEALAGVEVSVLNRPEFGSTRTRGNGLYDLAVNGGGPLTVNYSKNGFLPLQRFVTPKWQSFAAIDDVIMIPLDPNVTAIDFSEPVQVARGSLVTDEDGVRQATTLFFEGTQAEMVMPDGSVVPLPSLSVRATEYTVGENGPQSMPAPLPPSSGYTYAVELSADEAISSGAEEVRFSRPVSFYLENFLGLPIGEIVPVGLYDRSLGKWGASQDGVVVGILDISDGLARISVAETGEPASLEELDRLGFSQDELGRLAALYQPGQTLWRATLSHFTPCDLNWGRDCDPDAACERSPDPQPRVDDNSPNFCPADGSIIECQNQVLGERVALVGTRSTLNYRSDRVPGRRAARIVSMKLSGTTVPRGLRGIEVIVEVAGQRIVRRFSPAPNLRFTFEWDGKDAYGRKVQGSQIANVRIGYSYKAIWLSRGQISRASGGGPSGFAAVPSFNLPPCDINGCRNVGNSVSTSRNEITLFREFETVLGTWDARGIGLGGWTLAQHHTYDPVARTLYLGDGRRRNVRTVNAVLSRVAGSGLAATDSGPDGDGGPAIQARLRTPRDLVVAPDGSVVIGEGCRVRKVLPDGTITTIAGRPAEFCSIFPGGGVGQKATDVRIAPAADVAIDTDGAVLFTQPGAVWRIDPEDETLSIVAGRLGCTSTGFAEFECGFSGDDGPATSARIGFPVGIDVGPDGSLYIAHFHDGTSGRRVRRVSPEGVITTVAGGGNSSGEGVPAAESSLGLIGDVAVSPDGSLFIATLGQINRVSPQGLMFTAATSTGISRVAVDADGRAYFTSTFDHMVRRLEIDGSTVAIVGTGSSGFNGDDLAALRAEMRSPQGVALDSTGTLYIADSNNQLIRKVQPPFPGFSASDFAIASSDGNQLFQFDQNGRHLRTLHTLTAATLLSFEYDEAGRLTAIQDGDGNRTVVEHDADGLPIAVVAPFGQRTTLTADGSGFLSTISNPADEMIALDYAPDGLMTRFTDARGNPSTFSYDDLGRLTRDQDAAGGFLVLERTDQNDNTFSVAKTTALGRRTEFEVSPILRSIPDLNGVPSRIQFEGILWENTFPTEAQSTVFFGRDNTQVSNLPSGIELRLIPKADPRWGTQSSFDASTTVTSPGGLVSVSAQTRAVQLEDLNDPLSLIRKTETAVVNGRSFMREFNAAPRQNTLITPEGRQSSTEIDDRGRLISLRLDPALDPITFSYDPQGLLIAAEQGNRRTTLAYDTRGRVSSTSDAVGNSIKFRYDAADRITNIILASGRTLSLSYDPNGNITDLVLPNGARHRLSYSAANKPESYRPPANQPFTSMYDQDGNWLRTEMPSGRKVEANYDQAGRLSAISYPEASIVAGYQDNTSRLNTLTRSPNTGNNTQQISFEYDGDLATRMLWTGAASADYRYKYDSDFALIGRTLDSEEEISFSRDKDGLLSMIGPFRLERNGPLGAISSLSDGDINVLNSYNSSGLLTKRIFTVASSQILEIHYEYDKLRRIEQKTEVIGGDSRIFSYFYDGDGQLLEVRLDGLTAERYEYDPNGNPIMQEIDGVSFTANFDEQDRLISHGDIEYGFNEDGFITHRGRALFDYSARGELLRAVLASGDTIHYTYDGANRLVARSDKNGTREYLYGNPDNLFQLTASRDSSGLLTEYFYDDLGHLFAFRRAANWFNIVTNQVGSPRLVTNQEGIIVKEIEYSSYGTKSKDTNPMFELLIGFAGGIEDAATGFVRFGLRDYDPRTGRWLTRDPLLFLGGQGNLFVYVGNDPINGADRTGLFAPALIGGVFGGVTSLVSARASNLGTFDTIQTVIVGFSVGALGGLLPGSQVFLSVASGAVFGGIGSLINQLIRINANPCSTPDIDHRSAIFSSLAGGFGAGTANILRSQTSAPFSSEAEAASAFVGATLGTAVDGLLQFINFILM